jgi:hypothetical protein
MRLLYRSLGGAAVMAGLLVPLGLVAPARAADPKPRTLFVEAKNDQKSFTLTADVDHKDHMYSIGDQVVVTVTSEKDGYLYIFNLDPDGEITCLFPNNSVMDNAITAGTPVSVPSGGKYKISVSEPTGKDIVKVLVSTVPLKTLSLDELNKGLPKKTTFPPIPPKYAKKLFYEAITGDTTGGNPDTTLQEDKNKFQQQNQTQYQEKCKQWACVDIELTTVGKGKPPVDKPSQDKPPVDKPTDKPKDKPAPDKPSQDKPSQDKPSQDKPSQDKPPVDKPKDKPTQDTPVQSKPTQDKPSQDKPTQGKPTQDTPVQGKPPIVDKTDKPTQDTGKPTQGKPTQDTGKPTQDTGKPTQDTGKPTQDKPSQDKPSQDKPSQDKPVQKP